MLPIWTVITVSIISSAAAPGQADGLAGQIKTLEERMEALKREVRDPLQKEYERRREALGREADLNALRYDIERAKRVYELRLAGDPDIVSARKATEAAEKALPPTVKDRVENNARLLAMGAEIEGLRGVRPEIDKMAQDLNRQLSERRQQLASSPALQEVKQAIAAADKAHEEFAYKHPKAVATRKARDDARLALEARAKELPERKAYDEAERAYAELQQNSPDLAKARDARSALLKEYEQKLQEAVPASDKGQAIQAQIKQGEQQAEQALAAQQQIRKQLFALREEVGKAPELQGLRDAMAAADKAYQEAYENGPQIGPARKARNDAREAYAKDKTDQAKAAMEEADRAYQASKQSDPEVARTRQAREETQKAYTAKLEEAVLASEKGVALVKQTEEAQKTVAEANTRRQELRRQLYALREEIAKTPELAAVREAVRAAEKALYDLPKTHPAFVEARGLRDEARQALETRSKALPERQAIDEADRVYDWVRRESPEAKQVLAARNETRRAYEAQLDQLLRTDAKGAVLRQQTDMLKRQREETHERERRLSQELYRYRAELERSDPVIVEARKAATAARQAYDAAVRANTAEEQKAVYGTTRALEKHLEQKVAEDIFLQAIRERLKQTEREIETLYKEITALRRPAGHGP